MSDASSRPLKILLPTLGSSGDVHPVVALALALRARGHDVTILTNEFFGDQIRAVGIPFLPVGTLAEGERILADPRLWDTNKAFQCIAQLVLVPNMRRLYRLIEEHADSRTVVTASGICLGARVAHEKLRVPLATVHLQPSMLRSAYDTPMLGRMSLGPATPRWLKRGMYWIADRMIIDPELEAPLNEFRGELGFPAVRHPFREYIHSPQLVLGLFADWFAPVQPDWPKNTHLPGFVLYDGAAQNPMPREAEEFLASGSPPVLFTPGSGAATLHQFFEESAEACRKAQLRGMLVTNFPEQLPAKLPENVRAFSYLPFSQVLPRCSLMVYPGGIGTMAQTIRAGIPHLVVPHAHDQPDNAARIKRLGLGDFMYPEKYRAAEVADALRRLSADATLTQRCREFASRIDSQAALERACTLIESLGPE